MKKKIEEPAFVGVTLKWCNERRKERGLTPLVKLPKGIRGDGYSCPCGAATNLFVGVSKWGEKKCNEPKKLLPQSVQSFVRAFDSRQLPQYEKKSRKNE